MENKEDCATYHRAVKMLNPDQRRDLYKGILDCNRCPGKDCSLYVPRSEQEELRTAFIDGG